ESTHEVEPGRPCRLPTRQLRAPSGRGVQRPEARSEESQGVRSVRSNQGQPRPSNWRGADAGEGADTTTQPAKETSAIRTMAKDRPTSLQAITNKATQDQARRFGGLYRLLNFGKPPGLLLPIAEGRRARSRWRALRGLRKEPRREPRRPRAAVEEQ